MKSPEIKLCECGCGKPTNIAPQTFSSKGIRKGEHYRFIASHSLRLAPHTPERIAKMLKTRKGYKHSDEIKLKMSKARKGKTLSAEARKAKRERCRRGKDVYNWTGMRPVTKQIRGCFEYRQWRSDVFTRDDFTCVLCGNRGGYKEADHYPKNFAKIFYGNEIKTLEQAIMCAELWNINNGRTLCKPCHNATKAGKERRDDEN